MLEKCLKILTILLDVTITAKRAMEAVGRDHGVEVWIHLIAYADDVSAIVIGDTEAELQLGIDAMMKEFLDYFSSCGLSMNPSKSELIVFRRGRQQQTLHVGGQEEETHTKLLGVMVQKGYNFQKHATTVVGTVRTKMEKSMALKLMMPVPDT